MKHGLLHYENVFSYKNYIKLIDLMINILIGIVKHCPL